VGLIKDNWNARVRLLAGGTLVVAVGLVSGCMNSPTYGTDKTANKQLMEDLSNIASFQGKKRPPIEYSPRPDLVKPSKESVAVLPQPQDPITQTAAADWPESPEQRLARIRADATANQNNPNYDSPVVPDVMESNASSGREKKLGQAWRAFESGNQSLAELNAEKAKYAKRKQELDAANAGNRRYLSDPPPDYEQAYVSAPQGDPGEDEYKKERRKKREATRNRAWWDQINPF
jgi:hypothetical protein